MDFLKENLHLLGIQVDEEKIDKFRKYMDFLIEYNQKVNLTAITDPKAIIIKHFIDSIMIEKEIGIKKEVSLIDVGTGAGFPGIPLKIINPSIQLTLIDSLNKRVIFLKQLIALIDIKAEIIHSRAEELSNKEKYRESFDVAVSRAVAPLNVLSEYCMPFVKVGGSFISMKSENPEDEIECSRNAIEVLGGELKGVSKFKLPDGSGRSLIIINKKENTKKKYPRISAKIAKNPL